MYSILICSLIGFICGMLHYLRYRNDERRRLTDPGLRSVYSGTLIGCGSGILMGLLVSFSLPMHEVASVPVELAPMEVDGVKGVFALGTNGISEHTYHLNKRERNGAIVAVRLWNHDNIYIFEDHHLQDRATWITIRREVDPSSSFFSLALSPDDRTRVVREELHVPVGSVMSKFSIDY